MENRERDRVSQRTSSTDAGEINRKTSAKEGREDSGTGTEFGQNIGRSENLGEGESMENKNRNLNQDKVSNTEQTRRPSGDSGFGSSSGRRSGSMDESSNISSSDELDELQSDRSRRSGSMGNSGSERE